jgi:hypothetical protein
MSKIEKDIEIAALRSQLALCHQKIINHKRRKPLPTSAFRQLWVLISKLSREWESYLILVKPETVIGITQFDCEVYQRHQEATDFKTEAVLDNIPE